MKFHFPIAWNKYTDTKQRIYTKHLMTSKMHSLQPNYKFFVPAQRILWKPKFHTDSKGICQVARGADDRNSKVTSTIGGHAKKKKLTANKKRKQKRKCPLKFLPNTTLWKVSFDLISPTKVYAEKLHAKLCVVCVGSSAVRFRGSVHSFHVFFRTFLHAHSKAIVGKK